jgi:hypothetical protein
VRSERTEIYRLTRSGDSHHEEQGRRLENAHPKVSIPELRLALR